MLDKLRQIFRRANEAADPVADKVLDAWRSSGMTAFIGVVAVIVIFLFGMWVGS